MVEFPAYYLLRARLSETGYISYAPGILLHDTWKVFLSIAAGGDLGFMIACLPTSAKHFLVMHLPVGRIGTKNDKQAQNAL